jgi:tetrahydromethanopterin S-methyltransferase subunit E
MKDTGAGVLIKMVVMAVAMLIGFAICLGLHMATATLEDMGRGAALPIFREPLFVGLVKVGVVVLVLGLLWRMGQSLMQKGNGQ